MTDWLQWAIIILQGGLIVALAYLHLRLLGTVRWLLDLANPRGEASE